MGHLRLALDPRDADALMGMRKSVRVAKVAEALDMDARRVRKLLAAGELEGHGVGKRGLRVYEDSVEEYRRRNQIGPRAPEPAQPRTQRRRGPTAAAREAMAALKNLGVFD